MQKIISYDEPGSNCSFSSHTFADKTASCISEELKPFGNLTMEINVYTPPYDPNVTPDGFIRVCFVNAEKEHKQIGIGFCQSEIEKQYRSEFNREHWLLYPDDPHSSAVLTSCFDEAWRIVCLLGASLSIKEIRLSYGN